MRFKAYTLAFLFAFAISSALAANQAATPAEGPVINAKVIVGPFDLRRKYRSMEGPYLKQELRVSDLLHARTVVLPESMVKFVIGGAKQPSSMDSKGNRLLSINYSRPPGLKDTSKDKRELYWLKRVKLDVLDENDKPLPTAEFFCHLVLYADKDLRNQAFPNAEPMQDDRMIILTQGQTDFKFPQGFAVPVASDENWILSCQSANRTTNKHRRIKHQLTLSFIKDDQLTQPIKALHWLKPYIAVLMDKSSESCHQDNPNAIDCQLVSTGTRAPNAVGASVVYDNLGRKLSGHWVVPPGTHTYRFPIALEPGLSDFAAKNRRIHAVWSHIHPLCSSVSLINGSSKDSRKVFTIKAQTNLSEGLQLKHIDTISSEDGIPLAKGKDYYLEATYVNNSGTPQDSMIGEGIFFADENFKRPDWAAKDQPNDDTLYTQSRFHAKEGEYTKAAELLDKYIHLKQNNPEKTYFYRGWHLCELAEFNYQQKHWSEAIANYKEALAIFEHSRRWPEILMASNQLANCYVETNQPAQAEAQYKYALSICEKIRHLQGLETYHCLADAYSAIILSDYASLLKTLGRDAQIKQMLARSKYFWTKLDRELPPSNSASNTQKTKLLERLAMHYCQLGKVLESEKIYDMLPSGDSRQCRLLNNPSAKENQYMKEFARLRTREDVFSRRSELVSKYAYAVPSQNVLATFKQYQPILEIGAGTGYWAFLLRKMGIKVEAFEPYLVTKGNAWFPKSTKSWTTVLAGDETVVTKYPHYTLFMCYPPGRTMVAYNALKAYKGKHVIYVGEAAGVAPGEGQDKFHDLLKKEWHLEKRLDTPQWPGLYDACFVYRRK